MSKKKDPAWVPKAKALTRELDKPAKSKPFVERELEKPLTRGESITKVSVPRKKHARLEDITIPDGRCTMGQLREANPEVCDVSLMQALSKARPRPEPLTDATQEQIGGGHYKQFQLQPAEISERNNLTFLEGSVVKRMHRHSRGGKGLQDLEKAIHEIRLLAKYAYGEDI